MKVKIEVIPNSIWIDNFEYDDTNSGNDIFPDYDHSIVDGWIYLRNKYGSEFIIDYECDDEHPIRALHRIYKQATYGLNRGEWMDKAGLIKKIK